MRVTPDVVMALNPCSEYTRAKVARILHGKCLLDALLSVPPPDARWLVARLLTPEDREHWAYACADRAARYYAEGPDYAADAAYYAAAADAAAAKHRLAMEMAAAMIEEMP